MSRLGRKQNKTGIINTFIYIACINVRHKTLYKTLIVHQVKKYTFFSENDVVDMVS